jgi:hypothetical protein
MKTMMLVLLGLSITLTDARAHVSDTGQDYSSYLQNNGGSCCNQLDCRPVRYKHMSDGRLIMFPQGRAAEIAPALINPKPSTDGNARWCGRLLPNRPPETFCAILPPGNAHNRQLPARLKLGWHDWH